MSTPFSASRYQEKVYGLHQPYDRGYGVAMRDVDPRDRKASRNGRLINQNGEDIWFWVDEMEANFEITGSTAQSRLTRQFYPHNMAQPSFLISGVAPTNRFYNELASFVRASQVIGVTSGSGAPTIQFRLAARHQRQNPARKYHLGWTMDGYIKSMKAGGEKDLVAFPFQFEFIIAQVIPHGKGDPLFDDDVIRGQKTLSWLDFKKSGKGKGWVQDPTPSRTPQKLDEKSFDTNQVYGPPAPVTNPLDPNPNGNPFGPIG